VGKCRLLGGYRGGSDMRLGSLVTSRRRYSSLGIVLLVDTHFGEEWVHVKWIEDTHLDPIQYTHDLEVVCE
jgi:hypothetical protein